MRLFFPLAIYPLLDWTKGPFQFGAVRGGRKHAACDLVAPKNTEVFAITDGIVVEDLRPFYNGTSSIVINHYYCHVRYGELRETGGVKLKVGDKVTAGQLIGHLGVLHDKSSMLHFELYQGNEVGPYTNRANPPFMRRKDLLDPTQLLWSLVCVRANPQFTAEIPDPT
jgi:murein DD-endopeptidase MepM/ murein hydrolase activator NlpD